MATKSASYSFLPDAFKAPASAPKYQTGFKDMVNWGGGSVPGSTLPANMEGASMATGLASLGTPGTPLGGSSLSPNTGFTAAGANIGPGGFNLGYNTDTPNLKIGEKAGPEMGGGWMSGVGMGLQAAQVGLGAYNAMEQSKMNDFMKGYYGDQMNLKKADFANAAKDTNANLEQRQMNRLSAQGHSFDSQENKQGTADYMSKWGVKETY